jgi:choline-glycine betaine transporter
MIKGMVKDWLSFMAFFFVVCMGFGLAYQGTEEIVAI